MVILALQWLQKLMDRITDLGAFGEKMPNHVLVNEYLAGQGIMVSSLSSFMEKNYHHQYPISLFSMGEGLRISVFKKQDSNF